MAFNPAAINASTLKALVDNLARHLKTTPISPSPRRSHIQEAVAATLGWANWHAAITAAKNQNNPALSATTEPWRIPVSEFRHKDEVVNKGIRLGSSSPPMSEKIWRVDNKDMVRHAMMWGSEDSRRSLIERISHLNPDRPMVVINGPVSLSPRQWAGLVIEGVLLDQALGTATAIDIVESLVSRITSSGSDAQMWNRRAISLLSVVVQPLVWMRDNADLALDHHVIREYLLLDNVILLSRRRDLPPLMVQAIKAYLHSLPGYTKDAPKQTGVAIEQHGYLQMQFTNTPGIEFARVLTKMERLQSSNRARAVLGVGVETIQQERRLCKSLEQWVASHPGGLLVFDGLTLDSALWEAVVLRLAHWADAGVGVWVGLRVEADLPNGALRDRLLARMDGALHLD